MGLTERTQLTITGQRVAAPETQNGHLSDSNHDPEERTTGPYNRSKTHWPHPKKTHADFNATAGRLPLSYP